MKGGAIEFLTKPFRDQDLLDAVETGLARDRVLNPHVHEHINMLGRYSFAVPESVSRGELRPLRNPTNDDP